MNHPMVRLIKNLKTDEEIHSFLISFFTPAERATLSTRYTLVQHLLEGKTQREIATDMGISVSLASRGAAEVKYGEGKTFFPMIYKRLEDQ